MTNVAVIGSQWGDEGKGKIVDLLSEQADAVVQKVTPTLVQVFYPEDNETKRHNLLVSGITKKSPKPLRDYMEKGVRWKIKK